MGSLVFVYGTLKKGFPHHARYLGTARWIGDFKTLRPFPLVLNGERCSPCLVDAPGAGKRVRGEVYEVSPEVLAALDRLERTGATDGYRRRSIVAVPLDDRMTKRLTVYAYLKSPHLVDAPQSADLSEYTRELGASYRPRR